MNIKKENILKYAAAYDKRYRSTDDEKVEREMKRVLQKQRYLRKEELVKIGEWKLKRPTRHYKSKENDALTVKEITEFSLRTESEKAKIKSLLTLKGVSWPVASTILHFAFPLKYPIMDFRVIWSLGWDQPSNYNFAFWQKFCKAINAISRRYKLPIRMVEKSLWEYSKEHQKANSSRSGNN